MQKGDKMPLGENNDSVDNRFWLSNLLSKINSVSYTDLFNVQFMRPHPLGYIVPQVSALLPLHVVSKGTGEEGDLAAMIFIFPV